MIVLADRLMLKIGQKPLDDGAIVLGKGIIRDIGPAVQLLKRYKNHRKVDCRGSLVLPGLVNVHAHLELPSLLSTVRSSTYAQWVLNLIRSRVNLTTADYVRATHRNVCSLLQTGTTTVAEICTYGASPPIIRESGMRAVIFHEMVSLRPAEGPAALLPRTLRSSSKVRYGLSPHSPHTTSAEVIAFVRAVASRRHLPVCMHVAETEEEGRLLRRKPSGLDRLYHAAGWRQEWAPRGRSSFAYLARTGVLDVDFLAVHAVHANARDRFIIKQTGTAIAHCPRSNHELRVGTMPLKLFLDAGITVGLGTDSLASVATLSMWDEMRFALKTHLRSGVTARQILQLATIGGAKALGMERELGTLEPGKRADLIAVPLPQYRTGDLCSDLLRDTKSCTMAMVDGKILYRAEAQR